MRNRGRGRPIRRLHERSQQGSTLPRAELAHIVAPGAVTELRFEVDGEVDLKPYIDQGSVVESDGAGTLPVDDVTYEGTAVFTVHTL